MLRNSKPKIKYLTEDIVDLLNNMRFGKYQDSLYSPVDINCTGFYKSYNCCGGVFRLAINLEGCNFCGTEIYPYVQIKTPYDSWCCDSWNIADFTKDMEKFQKELSEDLKILRKHGIIS